MTATLAAALCLALQSQDQTPPPTVAPRAWSINPTNTMTWNGSAYMPVGVTVNGTEEEITRAADAGIKDVIVRVPASGDWAPLVQLLERRGLRYFLSVDSVAPSAKVALIEPESYRIPDLVGTYDLKINIPGGSKARVLLVGQNNNNIRSEEVLPIVNGVLRVTSPNSLTHPHLLIVYPITTESSMTDFWDGFDAYRDNLLQTVRSAGLGSGYRGLINPLGRVPQFMSPDSGNVPVSSMFRLEFKEYLQRKYGSVRSVMAAWGLSVNAYTTYDELTGLVPLWTESRGIPAAWHVEQDVKTLVAQGRSTLWTDLRTVIVTTAERRYSRLAEQIKEVSGGPVVQDWNGWGGPYETSSVPIDGVGYTATVTSSSSAVIGTSRAASSTLRRLQPTVCLATGLRLTGGEGAADPMQTIIATQPMGVRGWFFECETPEQMASVAAAAQRAPSELSGVDRFKTNVLYYPEAARNPVEPRQLTNGMWWLPAPGAGDIVDFGEGLQGYRYKDGAYSVVVFWADQPRRMKFKVADPKTFNVSAIDGTDLVIKRNRDDVEFMVLDSPLVTFDANEVPVPIDSFQVTAAMVDTMVEKYGELVDVTGNQKYELQQTLKAFDRNPTGAFLQLRKQWRDLLLKAAPYRWIEAESTRTSTFSAVKTEAGASDGRVLQLSSRLPSLIGGFSASYMLQTIGDGTVDVWISGSIPPAIVSQIDISIGGKEYRLDPTPVAPYGRNMAWYRVGQVPVTAGEQAIQISAPSGTGSEIMLDALMAYPGSFQPTGARPPIGWLIDALGQEPLTPRTGSDGR